MWLRCFYTGYSIQLGHMESNLDNGNFIYADAPFTVIAGQEIGFLVKDPVVGFIHNHTQLLRPLTPGSLDAPGCGGGGMADSSCSQVIDMFVPNITIGVGNNPPYGLWLAEFLPEATRQYIESGKIKPKY